MGGIGREEKGGGELVGWVGMVDLCGLREEGGIEEGTGWGCSISRSV